MRCLLSLIFASLAWGQSLTLTGPASAVPGEPISLTLSIQCGGKLDSAFQLEIGWPAGYVVQPVSLVPGKTLECYASRCILSGAADSVVSGPVARFDAVVPLSAAGTHQFPLSGLLGVAPDGQAVGIAAGPAYSLSFGGPPYDVTNLQVTVSEVEVSPMATIGPLSPAASADDWMIYGTTWTTDGYSGRNYFGRSPGSAAEYSGIRFSLSAAIPAGATIDSATLALYGEEVAATDDSYWYVVDSADAGQIGSYATRPAFGGGSTATLPNTLEGAGSVHYQTAWSLGAYNNIPVGPLIQALVNKYGGLAQNSHVHIIGVGAAAESDNIEAGHWNFEHGSLIPQLTINYTAEGVGLSIPVAMAAYRQQ